MKIDYPLEKTEQLSDGEQFAEVFKQLVKDKVQGVSANALGVQTIYFKDGTQCGGMWLWKQTGIFKNN